MPIGNPNCLPIGPRPAICWRDPKGDNSYITAEWKPNCKGEGPNRTALNNPKEKDPRVQKKGGRNPGEEVGRWNFLREQLRIRQRKPLKPDHGRRFSSRRDDWSGETRNLIMLNPNRVYIHQTSNYTWNYTWKYNFCS